MSGNSNVSDEGADIGITITERSDLKNGAKRRFRHFFGNVTFARNATKEHFLINARNDHSATKELNDHFS